METKNKSVWQVLSQINCNDKVEHRNGLTYLSWAWAWGIVKELYPDANYRVIYFDGKPYLFDEHLGYMVATEVTIQGETLGVHLPVLDNNNKAMRHEPYEVATYNKKINVERATMFDINTAIMRCLTKNLALFGLGHYIYAGEDLPAKAVHTATADDDNDMLKEDVIKAKYKAALNRVKDLDGLKALYNSLDDRVKPIVKELFAEKKNQLSK